MFGWPDLRHTLAQAMQWESGQLDRGELGAVARQRYIGN